MEIGSSNHSHLPVYNIKAVSRLLGLLPVTLRAWERRYGMPRPMRGQQGYRLYSEQDLRVLRWLKAQTDAGLSIGRAVDFLQELRAQGKDPVESPLLLEGTIQAVSLEDLAHQLLDHLLQFDEQSSEELVHQSLSLYPLERVLSQVFQPVLLEVGERWHRGELEIAREHFVTSFCLQQMMSLMSSFEKPSHPEKIIAACAPGEFHQVGLLMLVVLLRQRGYDVKYLGADLSLERLSEALEPIRPQMLLFSATRPEAARNLLALSDALALLSHPLPLVVLGGQAFEREEIPQSIPAIVLQGSLSQTVEKIESLLAEYSER